MRTFADILVSQTGILVGWAMYIVAVIGIWILDRKLSSAYESKFRFLTALSLVLPLLAYLYGSWYYQAHWERGVRTWLIDLGPQKGMTLLIIAVSLLTLYLSFVKQELILVQMLATLAGTVVLAWRAVVGVTKLSVYWAQPVAVLGFLVSLWLGWLVFRTPKRDSA